MVLHLRESPVSMATGVQKASDTASYKWLCVRHQQATDLKTLGLHLGRQNNAKVIHHIC